MDEIFERLTKDTPEMITSCIKMDKPNKKITIYEGRFNLISELGNLEIEGKIEFLWIPDLRPHFHGKLLNHVVITDLIEPLETNFELFIDKINKLGKCKITFLNEKIDSNGVEVTIRGYLFENVVLGDQSISVDKVIFSVPNFINFHRLKQRKKRNLNKYFLEFENDNHLILLYKHKNYKELKDELESQGGT